MLALKLKRARLSTVLSTLDPSLLIPIEVQRQAVNSWHSKASKLFISGPEAPASNFGVRHVKTASRPPIANLLATYMQTIPGVEVCMIANPDCVILDVMPLLNHIDAQKMEMAWAAHVNFGNRPSVFFMASPVAAHLINDLPHGTTFADDWQGWIHTWMNKMMRYRYFNATSFCPVEEIAWPSPPDNIPDSEPVEIKSQVIEIDPGETTLVELPIKRKRGRPRKVNG